MRHFRAKYGFAAGDFPVTDEIAARAISLPMFEDLTEAQQGEVVAALREEVVTAEPMKRSTSKGDSALTS